MGLRQDLGVPAAPCATRSGHPQKPRAAESRTDSLVNKSPAPTGRRRIKPHGREWRAACADLGIPDEKACHRLPLPRNAVERKLTYACPACQTTVQRVRKFRRPTACLHCCNRHAGGRYDGRFRLVLVGG